MKWSNDGVWNSMSATMIRRAFLRAAAGILGLAAFSRAQAGGPPQGSGIDSPLAPAGLDFPFPVVTVAGGVALEEWQRQRQRADIWPVVIGGDEDLERIAEGTQDLDDRSVESILAIADTLSHPESLRLRRAQDDSVARRWLAEHGHADDVEPDPEPEIGIWPDQVDTSLSLTVAEDIRTRLPLDRVHIALVPAATGWEAIAHLKWGGWNDNPSPEYHVAALRSWEERYGAELVGLNGDTMSLRVAHRPATRKEALDLAGEHYLYCADIVDQGVETLSALGATLMANDWWFFWWD